MHAILSTGLAGLAGAVTYLVYQVFIRPRFNPLSRLAGPHVKGGLWGTNLAEILSATISAEVHEIWTEVYGRSFRIRGAGPWDERLMTLDPVSVTYIMKNSTVYEKPWQSRKLISSLIGCGMLAAEGQMHKRQRRIATPAFSIQNLRALVPLVFRKGDELKNKWLEFAAAHPKDSQAPLQLDVCHWVSRATFDVIGVAGFDYNFNAIQGETNELFNAYKDMFEIVISQGSGLATAILIYVPWWYKLFPNKISRTIDQCQEVIKRVAGNLIQEKKRKIEEGLKSGIPYAGRDLLSLLLKSNVAVDLPPDQRISDEDILNNVNTFMFAGSDTSSLAVTWTLHLLANHLEFQTKLRDEMLSALPGLSSQDISQFTEDEIHTVYNTIASLPLLDNVVKESIRLIAPVHSSIRVATKDDEIPTSYPVVLRDGRVDTKRSVSIEKGSFVHIAVDGFNKDKEFWGPDAWQFNPDRWDDLPEAAKQLPGLYANTLTFSGGPRSCIGQRFSLIEIKSFIYTLVTNFVFEPAGLKVVPSNVVLTRPYLSKRHSEGSQCPLFITPYAGSESSADM
ncbi:cytochrome-450 hydroxylase [Coprinellus micaceus]|uniref:Cytochrome-450 hydroxylase n=1 Tax=Coprinellus micaceus TaxID=71717 RepID=A0A4Y7TTV7_COPMI|nr:cytochrome-450 hydroxylase [Coprinellus micaceus]